MTREEAAARADDIIRLLLTHQPGTLGTGPLVNGDTAQRAAQAIATFRKELIGQLEQQQ